MRNRMRITRPEPHGLFASRPPETTDPTPWLLSSGSRLTHAAAIRCGAALETGAGERAEYAPRPMFDVPRAHAANPILTAFREAWDGSNLDYLEVSAWDCAPEYRRTREVPAYVRNASDAACDHAFAVLRRMSHIADTQAKERAA